MGNAATAKKGDPAENGKFSIESMFVYLASTILIGTLNLLFSFITNIY